MTRELDPPDLTSTHLREMLDGHQFGDDPVESRIEHEAAQMFRVISRHVLQSRQNLINLPVETVESIADNRKDATWMLDDLYCHDMLERVPKMVRRTLELSALHIDKDHRPTGSVHVFYEQAVRCYIFGLWQAASVLGRSTVETALREKLKASPRVYLRDLVEAARRQKLLKGAALEAASVVKLLGDQVVHGEAIKENDAKRLVMCVRAVIVALFGGELGAESRPA